MALACRLLTELAGAKLVPGALDAHEPSPAAPVITLRHQRVGHILGVDITADESATTLERLGCAVDRGADTHTVTVPWHRVADLQREIDLIEEVGRIHGFDEIEAVLPRVTARARLTPQQTIVRQLARRAADLGLSEAISYRFVPEADYNEVGTRPVNGGRFHIAGISAVTGRVTGLRLNGQDADSLLPQVDKLEWYHVWPQQVVAGQPVWVAFHSRNPAWDTASSATIRVTTSAGDALDGTFTVATTPATLLMRASTAPPMRP
jgi:hypothetical protein